MLVIYCTCIDIIRQVNSFVLAADFTDYADFGAAKHALSVVEGAQRCEQPKTKYERTTKYES